MVVWPGVDMKSSYRHVTTYVLSLLARKNMAGRQYNIIMLGTNFGTEMSKGSL